MAMAAKKQKGRSASVRQVRFLEAVCTIDFFPPATPAFLATGRSPTGHRPEPQQDMQTFNMTGSGAVQYKVLLGCQT